MERHFRDNNFAISLLTRLASYFAPIRLMLVESDIMTSVLLNLMGNLCEVTRRQAITSGDSAPSLPDLFQIWGQLQI